jgi:hypothetical protein
VTKAYRTREHGLDIDMRSARFALTGEADDLVVKRARALERLGERWILHRRFAPQRLPARPGVIELGLAAETMTYDKHACS